jgi:hypothetical protein
VLLALRFLRTLILARNERENIEMTDKKIHGQILENMAAAESKLYLTNGLVVEKLTGNLNERFNLSINMFSPGI